MVDLVLKLGLLFIFLFRNSVTSYKQGIFVVLKEKRQLYANVE